MGLGQADGGMDLNNLLKPIITSPNVRLIGATTREEFEMFHRDKAFERRFHKLEISAFSKEEVFSHFRGLLENVLAYYDGCIEHPNVLIDHLTGQRKSILSYLDAESDGHHPGKLVDFFDYCAAVDAQNQLLSDVERQLKSLLHG